MIRENNTAVEYTGMEQYKNRTADHFDDLDPKQLHTCRRKCKHTGNLLFNKTMHAQHIN